MLVLLLTVQISGSQTVTSLPRSWILSPDWRQAPLESPDTVGNKKWIKRKITSAWDTNHIGHLQNCRIVCLRPLGTRKGFGGSTLGGLCDAADPLHTSLADGHWVWTSRFCLHLTTDFMCLARQQPWDIECFVCAEKAGQSSISWRGSQSETGRLRTWARPLPGQHS